MRKISMRYPKLRELKEAIKALIKGPYTTRFPYEPSVPPEKFRGKPEFDEKECVGCAACVQVCPSGALSFQDEVNNGKAKRQITLRLDICIFCGQCQANCLTEKGIRLTQEYDLATTDRKQLIEEIEKELVLCEACGTIIGPSEQINWVAEKLGSLAYANPTLILFSLQKRSLAELMESIPKDKPILRRAPLEILPYPLRSVPLTERADRIKILCPKCRRETVLKS